MTTVFVAKDFAVKSNLSDFRPNDGTILNLT